jgi:antitoxin component HigA of HigAB toxin-antitoxin module
MPASKCAKVQALKTVGDVRAFMARHRLKVKDLAGAYGASPAYVSHCLSGRRNLQPETFSRLKVALSTCFCGRTDHASCSGVGAGRDEG